MQVKKRDGKLINFDKIRIINAVEKAMSETINGIDKKLSKKITNNIEKEIAYKNIITVDEIQNLVENNLMASNRKDVGELHRL
jgi:anaerobic ribonucleoside-triphosphate reductase